VGESADISRLLLANAELLERRGFGASATLERRAARLLAAMPDRDEDGCADCGAQIIQPATGRRRRYCFDCSPRRLPKTSENTKLAA
jgi:DNA-directed RNA polymerase subunit RPC12/RpoP